VALPAGAVDRYVHLISRDPGAAAAVRERETPRLVADAAAFAEAVGSATVVAVDIDTGDVPDEPGRTALRDLATALAQLGIADLVAGRTADPAELVPAYVALPRGLANAAQDMEWSPDLR
jgi:hypothetical protein